MNEKITKENTTATPQTDETVKLVDVNALSKKEIDKALEHLAKAKKAEQNGILFANATDPTYEEFAKKQCLKKLQKAEKSVLRLIKIVKADALRRIEKDMIVYPISKELLDYDILVDIDERELSSFEGYLPKRRLKKIRNILLELKKYDK